MAKRAQGVGEAAGGLDTLVLVPTELELGRLDDAGGFPRECTRVELCGFGPVAAAAQTARWLSSTSPQRVLLVGIAGAYDALRAPVGSAHEFSAVALDGVGVGQGQAFLGPPALGFPQLPARPEHASAAIFDVLSLAGADAGAATMLVTTCAASADTDEAALRLRRWTRGTPPLAPVAEDMEAFAVAAACALARVPLCIVRGISNVVGDRDPTHWRIPSALAAAHAHALRALEHRERWSVPR